MDNFLEAAAADTVAHETKRAAKHSLPIGAPCPNCNTALAGPWCYQCGQRGEEYHRSILRLAVEAVMGLFDLDGRIWQTFPRLILRPGKLTRDYLDGHRAVQVPPFRIFLIVLLLVFFAGSLDLSNNRANFKLATPDSPEAAKVLSPEMTLGASPGRASGPQRRAVRRQSVKECAHSCASFDYLVGTGEDRRRDGEADSRRGTLVHGQLPRNDAWFCCTGICNPDRS